MKLSRIAGTAAFGALCVALLHQRAKNARLDFYCRAITGLVMDETERGEERRRNFRAILLERRYRDLFAGKASLRRCVDRVSRETAYGTLYVEVSSSMDGAEAVLIHFPDDLHLGQGTSGERLNVLLREATAFYFQLDSRVAVVPGGGHDHAVLVGGDLQTSRELTRTAAGQYDLGGKALTTDQIADALMVAIAALKVA